MLAGHGVGAGAGVGDHQVQHRVDLRFELAVGDDATDFGFRLRGQLAVLRGRELAGVGRARSNSVISISLVLKERCLPTCGMGSARTDTGSINLRVP